MNKINQEPIWELFEKTKKKQDKTKRNLATTTTTATTKQTKKKQKNKIQVQSQANANHTWMSIYVVCIKFYCRINGKGNLTAVAIREADKGNLKVGNN